MNAVFIPLHAQCIWERQQYISMDMHTLTSFETALIIESVYEPESGSRLSPKVERESASQKVVFVSRKVWVLPFSPVAPSFEVLRIPDTS